MKGIYGENQTYINIESHINWNNIEIKSFRKKLYNIFLKKI